MPPNAPRSAAGNRAQVARLHPLSTDVQISGRAIVLAPRQTSRRHPIRPIRTTGPLKRNSPTAPGTTHGQPLAWPSLSVARLCFLSPSEGRPWN
jgi:hypothetical protein